MAPQSIENAQFAEGNGAPAGAGRPQARGLSFSVLGGQAGASRLEMAPQSIEKARFAPPNGAPAGRVDPQARGLPPSNLGGQAECESPGNGAASD